MFDFVNDENIKIIYGILAVLIVIGVVLCAFCLVHALIAKDKPAPAVKHEGKVPLTTYKFGKVTATVAADWVPVFDKVVIPEMVKKIEAVMKIYDEKKVYPAKEDVFKPFALTPRSQIKAVIFGKIPFYRMNQADGLAFSTKKGEKVNQSTEVIIKEAIADAGIKQPANGSLQAWAERGVLMMNLCFTAPSDKPAAHTEYWEDFANAIVKELIAQETPVAFVCWGEFAAKYEDVISRKHQHMLIKAPNPSPLSAASGFYGSKPFTAINKFLEANGRAPIDWTL